MTEKIRDGISRELRYMEYRLRKRRSERDKKKSKNDNTKNYPTMADQDENFSPELKEALPSTAGEEDLQLQVSIFLELHDFLNHFVRHLPKKLVGISNHFRSRIILLNEKLACIFSNK